MRLYIVLLPFLFFGQSNLWSWPITNTTNTTNNMTKQDIEAQLRIKKEALEALLKKNNLTASAVFNTQQLAVIEQVYKILGVAEAPQDIGKKTFVDYVQGWVRGFINSLSVESSNEIEVNIKQLKTKLATQIPKGEFPISILLWNNIKAELVALEQNAPEASIAKVREVLLVAFTNFNTAVTNNKKTLNQEYKNNKSSYKILKEDDLNELLMSAGELESWLADFGDATKEKQDELKEKEEEYKEAFEIAYVTWLGEQRTKIGGIISTDKGTDSINTMSKAKFMAILVDQSQVWEKQQPELGAEIKGKILAEIQGDSLEIKDYVNALNTAFTNIETSKEVIAKHWYDKKEFVDVTGLITGLTANNDGTSKYDIVEEYIQWFGKVGGAVDSMKLSPNRQFIATKLIEGFGGLLTTPELNFFVPKLEENIKAYDKKYLSLQETSELWKSAIIHFIKNPDKISAASAVKGMPPESMDTLDSLLIGQAGVDSLQQMFKLALRPLPKPDALAKGEFIRLVVNLNDGTILTSNLMTTIAKEGKKPYAYPTAVQLDVSQGKSPYKFEAKPIFTQSPVIANEEVKIDFEYTIAFARDRGSSEIGGGSSVDYSETVSVERTTETSNTTGTEETTSNGSNQTISGSTTHGFQWEAEGSFFGLFSGSAGTSHEVTVGGEQEWTYEHSMTDVNTTTNTTGTTVGNSTSTGVSNSDSWNRTMEHGQDEGYITVKGILTSSNIEGDKMTLSIHKVTFSSPDMKGLGITQINAEAGKEVRWKK